MFEIIVGVCVCSMIAKIADADDESPLLWGAVTALLCFLGVLLSLAPFFRMLGAGILSFVILMVFKMVRDR
jgi:hypothetical protein